MSKTGRRNFRGRTTSKNRAVMQQVLLIQSLMALLVAGMLYLYQDVVSAYSALLGGFIYLLPSLYQVRKVFSPASSNNIHQVLGDLYKSEIWKMALTIVLFGVVFSMVRPIDSFSILGVFIMMQITAWLVPLLMRHRYS